MVEKTGINVDQLVELLVKNASAELTTFYYWEENIGFSTMQARI